MYILTFLTRNTVYSLFQSLKFISNVMHVYSQFYRPLLFIYFYVIISVRHCDLSLCTTVYIALFFLVVSLMMTDVWSKHVADL